MRAEARAAGAREEHLVVVTEAPLVSGAEHALAQLVAGISDDMRVTVASVDAAVGGWVASHRPGAHTVALPSLSEKRDLLNIPHARKVLAALRPTVVHLNKTEVGGLRYFEIICHTLPNTRLVSVVHHVEAPGSFFSGLLSQLLARRSDAVIAVGRSLARELESLLRLPEGHVKAIHNAIDPASGFEGSRTRPHARPFTAGMLTRLVPHKRVEDVVCAVSQLEGAELLVGGTGPELNRLQTSVRRLGLGSRVHFLEWVEPGEVLDNIDVYVLTSKIEGHPISLLQAQRAGLPIVASNVGGVPEIVTEGVDGFLFEPGDVAALAARLRELANDDVLLSNMAAAARAAAARRPSPVEVATSYAEVFWPAAEAV
ncbi:MAG: glycosyltransferase family 4 protein [Acidimicrobiales bacterium]|nr:glycosyltransferase family 4 protein [Acidimicrobiales bacterium]